MMGRKGRSSNSTADRVMAELDHELGNVVNGLLGMAQLVRDSGLNAEQDYWLKAIEQSGRQLGRLVDAFRRHGTSADCPVLVHPTYLDGIDLLEQVLISHEPAARSGGNRLFLIVGADLSRCWHSDPCLLRQLLDNLLGNAAKFTRSGTIVVEAAPDYTDSAARGALVLAVTDSGPGVNEEVGQRVFEAYQQGPDPDAGGSGLGLFICSNIVRALGGRIGWSKPSRGGARFELRLPGVVAERGTTAVHSPRLLRSMHCRLRLRDPLRTSVTGMLDRLGVAWSLDGATRAGEGEPTILIREAAASPRYPGPNLELRPAHAGGAGSPARRLRAPILECTLGPLLLQMGLEGLSADAGRD